MKTRTLLKSLHLSLYLTVPTLIGAAEEGRDTFLRHARPSQAEPQASSSNAPAQITPYRAASASSDRPQPSRKRAYTDVSTDADDDSQFQGQKRIKMTETYQPASSDQSEHTIQTMSRMDFFVNVHKKMSLVEAYTLAVTSKDFWYDPHFWNVVQNSGPRTHEGVRYIRNGKSAAQIAKFMQTHLPQLVEDGMHSLMKDKTFLTKLDEAYIPEVARGIRGFIMFMAKNWSGGMELLNLPGTIVTEEMQRRLNQAAYYGNFVLGFTHQLGRTYLEARVRDHKDTHAQQMLNWAAYNNFGFTYDRGILTSGCDYLLRIAADTTNPGRTDAQQRLNEAARDGKLGFHNITYLEARVRDHKDTHAQQMLNQAAHYGGLGFTDVTGRTYLEARVRDHKDTDAQQQLNRAARDGRLGFTHKTGRTYLEARVRDHKDTHAQKWLNQAAVYGSLGFTWETGRTYLEARVRDHKDTHAQKIQQRLKDAALSSSCTYLINRAAAGDRNALKSIDPDLGALYNALVSL